MHALIMLHILFSMRVRGPEFLEWSVGSYKEANNKLMLLEIITLGFNGHQYMLSVYEVLQLTVIVYLTI